MLRPGRKGAPSLAERRGAAPVFCCLFGHRDVHSAVSFVDCAHLEKLLDARDAAADAYAWRSEEGGYGYATITSDEGLSDLAASYRRRSRPCKSAKKVFGRRRKRGPLRCWKRTLATNDANRLKIRTATVV